MRFELIFMRIEDDNIICLEKKALQEQKKKREMKIVQLLQTIIFAIKFCFFGRYEVLKELNFCKYVKYL